MTNGKWQPPSPQAPVVPVPQAGQQVTVDQAMTLASQAHNQGNLQEAEAMLNKVLAFQPGFPPAFNLLGVIAHQVGKGDLGIELVGKAIDANPKEALFHSNRGEMCRLAGRLDDAVTHGRKAVKLAPRNPGAHSNLGIAYFDQQNYDKAETCQKRALALDPKVLPALNNRGSIFKERKDLANAAMWYKKALDINPDFLESLNNIGFALTDDNKAEEALPYLQRAVTLAPNYVEALNNLGRAHLQIDSHDEALAAFAKAVQLDPAHWQALLGVATVMQEKQDYNAAFQAATRALQSEPERAEVHTLLGRIHVHLGDESKAHACYDKALALSPDHASAFRSRGSLLLEQGKMQEAEDAFRTSMDLESEDGDKLESLFSLALAIKVVDGSDEHQGLLKAEEGLSDLSPKRAMMAHFALGKMYDDFKNYDNAFEHHIKGCALKRKTFSFDSDETTGIFERTAEIFTPAFIESLKPHANPSAKPIFVLGSPRSGSTLTEQIISSHPSVFGAGELNDFSRAMDTMPNTDNQLTFPDIMTGLTGAQFSHLATDYIKRLTEHAPNSPFITDKMPANFYFVGLIHALLPNATIIHVKRNALDTCVSCFQRLFAHNQHQSYDLTELGTWYRNYAALMDHWHKVLPVGAFHELTYEDLVSAPEAQAKSLIKACGLDWHDDCLNFHKNKRSIRTASVTQVREPIYKTSMEKWRRYENHLSPLIKALGPAAPDMNR